MMKLFAFLTLLCGSAVAQNVTTTGITCGQWQSMLTRVENLIYLTSDYTRAVCAVVPEAETAPCLEMAETLTPYIALQLAVNFSPQTVCQEIGYCKRPWWLF